MTLKEAIQILKKHSKWRRGANIKQTSPVELGTAIDLIIKHLENESNKM
ncbi:MAG: hypothetical protein KBE91_02615 [Bacteroidia bacterium]|nr:hypothetical protein [Bacteroidia bacterium]